MFSLAIYTAIEPGICLRHRQPQSFATASDAAAAGVAYLRQHPMVVGFEIEPPGLHAANDAAIKAQRITRAVAARKAKARRKADAKGGDHAGR